MPIAHHESSSDAGACACEASEPEAVPIGNVQIAHHESSSDADAGACAGDASEPEAIAIWKKSSWLGAAPSCDETFAESCCALSYRAAWCWAWTSLEVILVLQIISSSPWVVLALIVLKCLPLS